MGNAVNASAALPVGVDIQLTDDVALEHRCQGGFGSHVEFSFTKLRADHGVVTDVVIHLGCNEIRAGLTDLIEHRAKNFAEVHQCAVRIGRCRQDLTLLAPVLRPDIGCGVGST